ncbi:MAG TPA: hypothetical protein VD860_16900 [Azospirillum sp.]|nr:hypothetical protein [Azospirillum sp.]
MARLQSLRPRVGTLDPRTRTIIASLPPEQAEQERKRRLDDERKADPIRALYKTARWKRLRVDLYVARGGLCECGCGRLTVLYEREATASIPVAVFDHRDDARRMVEEGGAEAFFDASRIRLMAKPCHDRHTARTAGFARRG